MVFLMLVCSDTVNAYLSLMVIFSSTNIQRNHGGHLRDGYRVLP